MHPMRKYKPVELLLKDVPTEFAEEQAVCPNCLDREAGVIGRLGLRLVFKCQRCRVRFHRPTQMAGVVCPLADLARPATLSAVSAPPPAHLATVRRGGALEAVVRGHIAVVDGTGTLLGGAGAPAAVTPRRSCVKPLQALPFIRRAADVLGASDEEIAVACASHGGRSEERRVGKGGRSRW